MMAPHLAPTTYQGGRSLPTSTMVTQYRLDKAGKRWCRQNDITLSEGQIVRERTPTRRYGRAGGPSALVSRGVQIRSLCGLWGEALLAGSG